MFFSSYAADEILAVPKEIGFQLVQEQASVQLEGGDEVPFSLDSGAEERRKDP